MIGVALAAILMTAAYQVMVGQSRVYESQEQTIDMQQSVRAALDFMSRELRMAGYGVSAGTDVFVSVVNSSTGPDSIAFRANTDYGSLVVNTGGVGDGSLAVFPAPAPTMEFNTGSIIDILDGTKTLLQAGLQITNDPGGAGYGNPANPTASPTTLFVSPSLATGVPRGSYVTVQPRTIRYRVNNLVLQRNDGAGWQDLIGGVEDLQFVYAFDSEPDGATDTDANGIIWAVDSDNDGDLDLQVNADGSTAALATEVPIAGDQDACRIRAVRVSILVRTARQDPSFPLIGERPQVEDRDAAGTNDRFRRRLLQSVVKIRNLGLRI